MIFLWVVIKPFAKLGYVTFHNRVEPADPINHDDDPFLHLFKKLEVLHGPFKDMKYPSFSSVGSSFYPKLLGSYEKELHGTLERLWNNKYTEVLDIGCAEGYYAIGSGLKLDQAKIFAYDTDETARQLCHEMAKANNIEERVIIRETCTADDLKNFNFTGRALIICDCEGYEKQLFTDDNITNLKNCDLLIETHDFIDLTISTYLIQLLSGTHNITVVKSCDDIEKVKTYVYQETNDLSMADRMSLFRECRPAIMEWLVCTPKAKRLV